MDEPEVVTVDAVAGRPAEREVRISCPDATGLGTDVARLLHDFGLHIVAGDVSTDGSWAFMVFRVRPGEGVPPRWELLRRRLEAVVPSPVADALRALRREPDADAPPPLFRLTVACPADAPGLLHAIAGALWDADVQAVAAHVATADADGGPLGGCVRDEFWLHDNRGELGAGEAGARRAEEVCARVRAALGAGAEVALAPASDGAAPLPPGAAADADAAVGGFEVGSPRSASAMRRPCKDAASSSDLRAAVARRRAAAARRGGSSSAGSLGDASPADQAGSGGGLAPAGSLPLPEEAPFFDPAEVEVSVDNETSGSKTALALRCPDRKGLLYDVLRALKDVALRVAYGRIVTDEGDGEGDGDSDGDGDGGGAGGAARPRRALVELFVQDAEGGRVEDAELLDELAARLRRAAALPVRVGASAGRLTVEADVDAGGRGRPRVTFDVTRALAERGVAVSAADVFVDAGGGDGGEGAAAGAGGDRPPVEVHRFVVRTRSGSDLASEADRAALCAAVRAQLMGCCGAAAAAALPAAGRAAGAAGAAGDSPGAAVLRTFSSHWSGRLV